MGELAAQELTIDLVPATLAAMLERFPPETLRPGDVVMTNDPWIGFMTWHVEVPMMATIWPGSVAWAAGAVTWASTFPTATAMPTGRPVQPAACSDSVPALEARAPMVCSTLSRANRAKSGLSAARNSSEG